ncbi:MAG: hypothetical protein EOO07_26150, partial [Chitinophagaceae bacterium]
MELFTYLLKVSVCLTFLFAFYLVVLRKLTFFKGNRFYLLFSLLLSFIIPSLQFTIERTVIAPLAIAAVDEQTISQNVGLEAPYQGPLGLHAEVVEEKIERFDWIALLPYLYGAIVASLLLLAVWRLIQLLKHTARPVKEINGLKLVAKETGFTNCSFFNYVFVNENSLTQAELA